MAGKMDRDVMYLEIEKSRIEREKSKLVLDKSLLLYFVFMVVGVIGFVFGYLDNVMLNVMIIVGIMILVIGSVPYLVIVSKEEKKIKEYLGKLK
ncbi:hypothetical protein J4209_03265 [Candidatus Woesearchaeota archaeon]|nr:hypothetical protein [Candidatus Woesearchaeota archaeon]